jgi:phosphonate transport system substrate-binding protein
MTRSCTRVFAAAAILLSLTGVARAADRPLTLAFIPQENPEKLIGDIGVITGYLERALSRKVKGFVTHDHAAAVEALAAGQADISFMGALPFVLARARTGAKILLAEVYRGKPYYAGAIFVRDDGPIRKLSQLRGRDIAFADPISESGYLYPLDLFAAARLVPRGTDPREFFHRVYFAGGYQQAIQAVAEGFVDAAGVSIYALMLLPADQQAKIRSIALTPPIPSHAVIARKGIDPALSEAFVEAMLQLNRPGLRHLLKHVYGPDGYIRARPADYDRVADLARAYGLIK